MRTSSAMFNEKNKSWCLYIFQDFREKAFSFSCVIMLAVALYRAWFCYSALSLYLTGPTYLSQRGVGVPQKPLPASTPAIRPLFLCLLHSILSICCITFPSFVNSFFLTSPAWVPLYHCDWLSFAATWIEIGIIGLSQTSQIQTDRSCRTSFMCRN